MIATCGAGREWEYPPGVMAMHAVAISTIGEYIRKQHTTISEKVACRPIYELCVEEERMPGTIRMPRRWDQDVVNEPEE